jgi:hypothetical protein
MTELDRETRCTVVEAANPSETYATASEAGDIAARVENAGGLAASPRRDYTTSSDGDTADISVSTISRVGGAAALGTVIGTAIVPGPGTIMGAVLGGVLGALAPSILRYSKVHHQENGKPSARV